jgi:hypothetical protein
MPHSTHSGTGTGTHAPHSMHRGNTGILSGVLTHSTNTVPILAQVDPHSTHSGSCSKLSRIQALHAQWHKHLQNSYTCHTPRTVTQVTISKGAYRQAIPTHSTHNGTGTTIAKRILLLLRKCMPVLIVIVKTGHKR